MDSYDFIVCGSGSSGSVVARRLSDNPDVNVLLLEAGGTDDVPEVLDSRRWGENLGSSRDWAFVTRPNEYLNGRSLVWNMGKVLGGSSSINLMVWARGHRNDWNGFAIEAADPAWGYDAVLDIYRRIEDWQGEPDEARRGRGGLVFVQPAPNPNPVATAFLSGAREQGIPVSADHNGAMMEAGGGASISNVRIRDGRRLSVFRTYVHPVMDRSNLTVLTDALVTRILFDHKRRVTGVEVCHAGKLVRFNAGREVVLSMGAIQTPKVLMQSGIGDAAQLRKFSIDVVQHLPGVGANLQEHVLLGGCIGEYAEPKQFQGSGPEATFFWKSNERLAEPDLQCFILDGALVSEAVKLPAHSGATWTILPGLVRPQSRGQLRITGADPLSPVDLDTGLLSHPADVEALTECVRLCRAIGNSKSLAEFRSRELAPTGQMNKAELIQFIRTATVPYWHYSGTAKMGRDEMSVVDGRLKVYGVEGLRIADGSIMPNIASSNTMAPCVIIGERASEIVRKTHHL